MRKKLFSALLVFCLLFQFAVPVLWALGEPAAETTQPEQGSKPESSSTDHSKINFEVILKNEFPVGTELHEAANLFVVTLTPKTTDITGASSSSLLLGEENHIDLTCSDLESGDGISFWQEDIKPGDYTLKMSAEYYYQDITQDVTIRDNEKLTLEFSNSYSSDRGEGKVSPGVFPLGDINDDGAIDQADIDLVLASMGQSKTVIKNGEDSEGNVVPEETAAAEETEAAATQPPAPVEPGPEQEHPSLDYDAVYDLNRDGKTNLVDLCIMAINIGNEPREANPQYSLLPSAVAVEEVQEKAKVPEDGNGRQLSTIMEDSAVPLQIAPAEDKPISEENPVAIAMSFPEAPVLGGLVINAPEKSDNAPAKGTVKVLVEKDGKDAYIEVPFDDGSTAGGENSDTPARIAKYLQAMSPIIVASAEENEDSVPTPSPEPGTITVVGAKATIARDGSISIDLGGQVAVKSVTIIVARAKKETKLTEIAKVEFLNDMAARIPEPEVTIPTNITISGGLSGLAVTWKAQRNVTGYEVEMQGKDDANTALQFNKSQIYKVAPNRAFINNYLGSNGGVGNGVYRDKIAPEHSYRVRVRAVNGDWSGPWSEWTKPYQVRSTGAPHRVDGFRVNPKYKQLNTSWQATVGSRFYTLEYKLSSSTEWITAFDKEYRTSYNIMGLEDCKNYDVRVCGWNYDPTKYDDTKDEAWNKANAARQGPWSNGTGKTTSEEPVYNRYNVIPRDAIASASLRGPIDVAKYDEGYCDGLLNGYTSDGQIPQTVKQIVAESMLDGDYSTYFASTNWADIGITVEFENEETLSEIIATSSLEDRFVTNAHNGWRTYINWFDETTNSWVSIDQVRILSMGAGAKNTLRYVFNEPIKAKKLSFGLHKYYNEYCTFSEVSFVRYSSLEENVYGLYSDDMHVELKETAVKKGNDLNTEEKTVNTAYIKELRDELEASATTYTNANGEATTYKHPSLAALQSELEFAEMLFNDTKLKNNAVIRVNPEITKAADGSIVFAAGTSGYQPLGYVAAASTSDNTKKINVYAGQKGKKLGERIDARLVFTQYFAEASGWQAGEVVLQQGMNEIEIPQITSLDTEWGGSIYVVHTSNNLQANPVEIRVTGATKIPVLDLHRPVGNERLSINEAQWKEKIEAYLTELAAYVEKIPSAHEVHQPSLNHGDADKQYAYNRQTCFLNATEIGLDNVLMSIPATQVWDCLKGTTIQDKTDSMYNTVVAMTQMMEMLYKKRGLNPGSNAGNNRTPKSRFNMRYHRMIAGAAGYAGGLHLGLTWGTVGGTLMGGNPIVVSNDGRDKYVSGNLFGWLVAHEMGHNADGGGVVYQEITNNIWSQFVTSNDDPSRSRPNYQSVYKHVTTPVAGKGTPAGGGQSTALAMYWQLHLAYDKHYTFYDYYANRNDDGTKQTNADGTVSRSFDQAHYDELYYNEFFARFYSFRRNLATDPCRAGKREEYMKKLGIREEDINSVKENFINSATGAEYADDAHALAGIRYGATTDQNIMRTACVAAGRDLTEFFEAWGMTVDAKTKTYASQFPKENRKVQYINDTAFAYQMENKPQMSSTEVAVDMKQGIGDDSNKIAFTFSLPGEQNPESILGYELIRNGKPVAFVPADNTAENATTTYNEVVASLSNRVMNYSVVAYDKYLNTTAEKTLDAVKIRHQGELPKDGWYVSGTNMVSDAGILHVEEGTSLVEGQTYKDIVDEENKVYHAGMDVYYMGDNLTAPVAIDYGAKVMFDGDYNTAYNGTTKENYAWIDICLNGAYDVTGIAIPDCKNSSGAIDCANATIKHAAHHTHPWSFELWFKCENKGYEKSSSNTATLMNGMNTLFCKPYNASQNMKAFTNATHVRIRMPGGKRQIGFAELEVLTPSGDNVDIGISTKTEGGYNEAWSTEGAIGILEKDYIVDEANDKKIPAGSIVVFGSYTGNPAYNVVSVYDTDDQYFAGKSIIFAPTVTITNNKLDDVSNGTWVAYLEPLTGENEGKYGVIDGDTQTVWYNDISELPKKIYAELYRVDDPLTNAGQRLVSDSFVVDIPTELPKITLGNTTQQPETTE